ncbi:unnamed protein product [Acanthoscelides obtectus]|uniref:Uncharacterized protein n=1 Tax=Acanthoscelides obtectus TaxID=200917 RepID=A0A9P0PIR8_ACAOB|nr:unnamed protein product [Acanthoscelides obtectus]CAK1646298.1 hypothetical protein AOBTE_LOCUS14565 [Acanthoscelides obtectus]
MSSDGGEQDKTRLLRMIRNEYDERNVEMTSEDIRARDECSFMSRKEYQWKIGSSVLRINKRKSFKYTPNDCGLVLDGDRRYFKRGKDDCRCLPSNGVCSVDRNTVLDAVVDVMHLTYPAFSRQKARKRKKIMGKGRRKMKTNEILLPDLEGPECTVLQSARKNSCAVKNHAMSATAPARLLEEDTGSSRGPDVKKALRDVVRGFLVKFGHIEELEAITDRKPEDPTRAVVHYLSSNQSFVRIKMGKAQQLQQRCVSRKRNVSEDEELEFKENPVLYEAAKEKDTWKKLLLNSLNHRQRDEQRYFIWNQPERQSLNTSCHNSHKEEKNKQKELDKACFVAVGSILQVLLQQGTNIAGLASELNSRKSSPGYLLDVLRSKGHIRRKCFDSYVFLLFVDYIPATSRDYSNENEQIP